MRSRPDVGRSFETGDTREKLARLESMADLWTFMEKLPEEKAPYRFAESAILDEAQQLAYSEPYFSLGAIDALTEWQERAAHQFADRQTSFSSEAWKRRGVLYASYAPAALLCHLALWALLLTAYPTIPRVQSFVFYNPWARKVLALGYLDIVLLAVPAIRRLLFAPLREQMLGKLGWTTSGALPRGAYYRESGIVPLELGELDRAISRAETETILGVRKTDTASATSLSAWNGRVLLIGPSGRGKTSFVRHHLLSGNARLPAVYLTAEECASGVPAAIAARVGALGSDNDLIASLVRAGKLDVYIDGLNEVAPVARSHILNFVADNVGGNLFLATQQLSEGLPAVQALYLLPLSREQMGDFLLGREPFLDISALVRGDAFRDAARAFLGSFESQAQGGVQVANAKLKLGFFAKLANPMDLQTAADLLSRGVEPDPLNLQRQQFEIVEANYHRATGSSFPARRFAKSVLKARLDGTVEIDAAAFPGRSQSWS